MEDWGGICAAPSKWNMTDERIAEIEWQAKSFRARDYPGTARMLEELIAALREARAALAGRTVSCERCNAMAQEAQRG